MKFKLIIIFLTINAGTIAQENKQKSQYIFSTNIIRAIVDEASIFWEIRTSEKISHILSLGYVHPNLIAKGFVFTFEFSESAIANILGQGGVIRYGLRFNTDRSFLSILTQARIITAKDILITDNHLSSNAIEKFIDMTTWRQGFHLQVGNRFCDKKLLTNEFYGGIGFNIVHHLSYNSSDEDNDIERTRINPTFHFGWRLGVKVNR